MLQRDEHARTYNRVKSLWPRSESVDVHIPDWNQPIQFPIPFLETSGDNTWQLVHRVLSYLVNEPGELRLLSTLAETRMNAEDKPKAGSYTFVPIGEEAAPICRLHNLMEFSIDSRQSFSWRRGPQGHSRHRAPQEGEGDGRSSSALGTPSSATQVCRQHQISMNHSLK